ncbi:MAG TPA: hypothetical protein VHP36_07350 [Chitinispirillaceae bacterium]|nr:hypothetical protein [Chitinispirillaceae bacterium]
MKKCILPVFLLFFLLTGCGSGVKDILLEPQKGLIIRICDIKLVRSQNRVIGFVEMENKTEQIIKVSNRELFLYCGGDSVSALVKMPGEWEIDKGLINVTSAKTVRYQVYWPLTVCNDPSGIKANYVKVLDREEE